MTLGVVLDWLLTAAGGGLAAGLVRVPLRVEERCALSLVMGIAGGSTLALLLGLALGMTAPALLLGPASLGVVAFGVARVRHLDLLEPWRETIADTRRRGHDRLLWAMAGLVVVASVGFGIAFAHTLFGMNGSIEAGFATVWADWSLHATSASSFAVGHNLPPHDPVFSGTPYRYPFLADFHSGALAALGSPLTAALAVPSAVLCVAVTVLVVSLAVRLRAGFAAGVVAMALCLLGGGLGAGALWWDACARHGDTAATCAPSRVVTHPADAVGVLSAVPAVVRDQPRAYDNLLTAPADQPVGNLQWYTPLMAWWLPQRTFVYGFALVVAVLLLVAVGLERAPPAWSPFVAAGLLAGLLPLVHVHSFIALVVALPLIALVRRRREWWALLAAAAAVAVPRLAEIAAGGHGVENGPYGSNVFPYLEPGWLSSTPAATFMVSPSGLGHAAGRTLQTVAAPGFWGFWVLNWGLAVPLCLLVVLAVAGRHLGGSIGAAAARVASWVPEETLLVALPLLAVFVVANIVVFQAWDWDNTKLFAYAYLGVALVVGAWASRWWSAGGWRAVAGAATVASLLVSGTLVMLRFLPWTPTPHALGPYTWASADEVALAEQVDVGTPPDAVVLTGGRPNDPLLTLAGRTAVMGYAGWLNSYGTDFGTRPADVATMYRGCPDPNAPCEVDALLRRYGVDIVEIGPWERDNDHPDENWWAATFPVLARGAGITVYDVRRP